MGFQPSQEMIQVRRSARKLYDEGLKLVGEWCKKIPSLTPGTWRKWEAQGGFLDWWSELFPEHGGVTICDLQALEYEANRALMNALTEGDLQAVNMVIKMMGMRQAANTVDETGLDDWFKAEADGSWIPEVAKA